MASVFCRAQSAAVTQLSLLFLSIFVTTHFKCQRQKKTVCEELNLNKISG